MSDRSKAFKVTPEMACDLEEHIKVLPRARTYKDVTDANADHIF